MKTISTEVVTTNGFKGTWNFCFEFQGREYGYLALQPDTCHGYTSYIPVFVKPFEWLAQRDELIMIEEHATVPAIFFTIGTDEGMNSFELFEEIHDWMDRILAMTKLDTFRRLEEIIDRLLQGDPTLTYQALYQRIARIDSKQHLDKDVFEVFILLLLDQRRRANKLAYQQMQVMTEVHDGIRVTRMPF